MLSAQSLISLNVPGKTFLLGEYVAIYGGPSIVAATGPYFEIDFFEGDEGHPFHSESPAGRYITAHGEFFKNVQIEYYDPYDGAGGFGASTAQFVAVVIYHKKIKDIEAERPFKFDDPALVLEVWQAYRALFQDQANPPSGADLIAQMVGGVSSFRVDTKDWMRLDWAFEGVELNLYKTPLKVRTHEHLAQLEGAEVPVAALSQCVEAALVAIKTKNIAQFRDESRKFLVLQEQASLLDPDARELIAKTAQVPGVDLVRGCGALGADVVAVYGKPQGPLPQLQKIASVPGDLAYGTWLEVT